MRRTLAIIASASMALSGLFTPGAARQAAAADAVQASFYVSPTGSDANDGSEALPFRTIGKAKTAVRAVNGAMTGDIYVYLEDGTYRQDETLTFGSLDSGTNGHHVVYTAAEGAHPVISGGVDLTTGWELYDAGKNIYKRAGVDWNFRQLYVDDQRGIRARQPNLSPSEDAVQGPYYRAANGEYPYVVGSDALDWAKRLNGTNAEMVIVQSWSQVRGRIDTVNELSGQVNFKFPESGFSYNHHSQGNSPYFFENDLSLLDAAGEFFVDTAAQTLYYKPRSGETMNATRIVAPKLETVVSFEGSPGDKVHDIEMSGISFEDSNWLAPSSYGYVDVQAGFRYQSASGGNNAEIRNTARYTASRALVELKHTSGITIDHNTFRHTGSWGIMGYEDTDHTLVTWNSFVDSAGGGVAMGIVGDLWDDDEGKNADYTLPDGQSRYDTITNNTIDHVAIDYGDMIGIGAMLPQNMTIANNEIRNMPYSGISIGWNWSDADHGMTNNQVHNNYIHDGVHLIQDGGGIYTLGRMDGKSDIYYNYVKNLRQGPYAAYNNILGVYLDGQTRYRMVERNVIENTEHTFSGAPPENVFRYNYYNVDFGGVVSGNSTYGNIHVDGTDWPQEALDIIAAAGPGKAPLPAPTEPINLALKKTATASTQSQDPSLAVDGDSSTRWAQALGRTDEQWLKVDLGDVYNIASTSTMFELNNGYKYKIEYSTDGEAWQTYADKTAAATTQQTNVDVKAVSARYMRISMTHAWGGSIYEFSVYPGEGGTTPQANSLLQSDEATFDHNPSRQADIQVKMVLNGGQLSGIKNGDDYLVPERDYKLLWDRVLIGKAYLLTLPAGMAHLTFDFATGDDPVLKVDVIEDDGSVNVALGKPASASSQSLEPSLAVDGNTGTRWAQQEGIWDTEGWLAVDLQGVYAIQSVTTMFELPSGYKYKIEYSMDGQNWQTFADRTATTTTQQTYQDQSAGSVTARYMRIKASYSLGPSIYEFSVFGKPVGSDSSLDRTAAAFDKQADQQADITVGLDLQGNTLTGIKNRELYLRPDTDYSVNGSQVVIHRSYLATLGEGENNLTFEFSAGISRNLEVDVTEPVGGEIDIALGKPVAASSQSKDPQLAVDGNPDTRWAQQERLSVPQWLKVDLGGTYAITGVKTVFELGSGYKYKIETSTDGVGWSTYADKTAAATTQQTNEDRKGTDVAARYVRLSVPDSSGNGTSVYSFSVFTLKGAAGPNSSLNPTSANFDKNAARQRDAVVDVNLNGNTLVGVKNGDQTLTRDTDYTFADGRLTIAKTYLAALNEGTTRLTVLFSAGANAGLDIHVADTSGSGDGTGLEGHAKEIYDALKDPDGRVLTMAHREDWKHHPENSLSAIQGSIDDGTDIAEMDVQRTSDGHYVLMHDGSVNRTTNGSGNVSGLTLAQLQNLRLKMHWGDITGDSANLTDETVPELRDVMELVKGNILVNLDKTRDLYVTARSQNIEPFTYWNEIWDMLEETGTTQLAIFKGEAQDITPAEFERWVRMLRQTYPDASPVYMPIISPANGNAAQIQSLVQAFAANTVQPVAYEVQFPSETAAPIAPEVVKTIHDTGARVMVNVMDDGYYSFNSLNAGNNDSAMFANPDKGWPWVIGHGAGILQTDVSPLLQHYLAARDGGGNGTPASQTVTLQQGAGYSGTADTHISQSAAAQTHNMGGNDRFEVGAYQPPLPLLPGSAIMDQLAGVTASANNPPNETDANLIDKSLSTKWLGGSQTTTVTFRFRNPVALQAYALTSANDSPGRDVKSWKFEGSNDQNAWTKLDERANQSFADRFVTNTYPFANEDAYTYYRFSFNNNGDSLTQLAEIQLSDGGTALPQVGEQRYGLLRFDLSSLPEGAVVTGAELGLYMIGARSSTGKIEDQTIGVHRVTSDWQQGAGKGIDGQEPADPNAVTWASFAASGAYDAAPAQTRTVRSTGVETWQTFEIPALVNGWLRDPASNRGVLLKVEDADAAKVSTKQFASSENAIASIRPKLKLTYTVPVQSVEVAQGAAASLTVGDTLPLTAIVKPAAAFNAQVVWSSDNEGAATVSADGVVTAVGQGSAVVTATSVDGAKRGSIRIDVAAPAGSIRLSGVTLSQGALTPAFAPDTTDYTAALPEAGSNALTLTASAENAAAALTLAVNGGEPQPLASGAAASVALQPGENALQVSVAAADGSAQRTYTFRLTKPSLFYQFGADGYSDTADAHIIRGNSHRNSNTGGNNVFEVGYYDQLVSDAKYGLIRFGSLEGIPDDAVITGAQLHLYLSAIRGRNVSTRAYDTTIGVHQITAPWVEGAGTGIDGSSRDADGQWVWWDNQPTFDANPVSTAVVGTQPGTWYAWDIASLVQQWVSDPDSNYGMLLKYPDPAADGDVLPTTKDFASKENGNASLRPYVTVTYIVPARGVQVTPNSLDLAAGGDPVRLSAAMVPLNGASETMSWASSDTDVATVDEDGTVHPVAEGTAVITVTTATSGFTAQAQVRVHTIGADAGLRSLGVSGGVLSPAFAANVAAYTVDAADNAQQIRVTPTAADPFATIAVIGPDGTPHPVKSGAASGPIALNAASQTVRVQVVSEDGSVTNTYELTVRKTAGLSGLVLSAGSLTPAFSPAATSYRATVAEDTDSVAVTPTALNPAAAVTVSVNGQAPQTVASGSASAPLPLQPGSNVILVQAAAAGGLPNPVYAIVVERQSATPPTDPTLDEIAFDAAGYTLQVGGTKATKVNGKLNGALGAELTSGVTYASANPAVAAVDASGTVTGKQAGSTVILAFYRGYSAQAGVTVYSPSSPGGPSNPNPPSSPNPPADPEPGQDEPGGDDQGTPPATEPPGNGTPSGPSVPSVVFADTGAHWAQDAIAKAVERGIVTGYADGTFQPNAHVTRAQFAIMLARALGLDTQGAGGSATFADAAAIPAWAAGGLQAAVAAGILGGYEDGTIRPNAEITREEMIVMLMRAFGLTGTDGSVASFRDAAAIHAWAKSSVAAAVAAGVVGGRDTGEFAPQSTASRAEAVSVIVRLMDRQNQQ